MIGLLLINNMIFSKILKNAPRYLSIRFNSLNSYVWESLFPENFRRRVFSKIKDKEKRRKEYKKMRSISEEASILVFIFVLRKIFIESSKATKETVDMLKELNVNGFYLGKRYYEERNKNVIAGDELAKKLFLLLDARAKKIILNTDQIYEILDRYQKIKNEFYG